MRSTNPNYMLGKRAPLVTTLTDEQRTILYERYIAGEGPAKLIEELGLGIASSQFMRIFPPDPVGGSCPLCSGRLMCAKQSRNGPRQATYCDSCGHSDQMGARCYCAACSAEVRHAFDERRAAKVSADAHKLSLAKARYHPEVRHHAQPMAGWSTYTLLLLGSLGLGETNAADGLADDLLEACLLQAVGDLILVPSPDTPADFYLPDGTIDPMYVRAVDMVAGPASEQLHRDRIAPLLQERLHADPAAASALWLDLMTNDCMRFIAWRLGGTTLAGSHIPDGVGPLVREHLTQRTMQEMTRVLYIAVEKCKSFATHRTCRGFQHATNGLMKHIRSGLIQLSDKPSLAQDWYRSTQSQSNFSLYLFDEVMGDVQDVRFRQRLSEWRATFCDPQESALVSMACLSCGSAPMTLFRRSHSLAMICANCGVRTHFSQADIVVAR